MVFVANFQSRNWIERIRISYNTQRRAHSIGFNRVTFPSASVTSASYNPGKWAWIVWPVKFGSPFQLIVPGFKPSSETTVSVFWVGSITMRQCELQRETYTNLCWFHNQLADCYRITTCTIYNDTPVVRTITPCIMISCSDGHTK